MMLRYNLKDILKVIIRLKVIRLSCFCYTVYHRRSLGSVDRIDHLPVLLSDTESADRPFRGLSECS